MLKSSRSRGLPATLQSILAFALLTAILIFPLRAKAESEGGVVFRLGAYVGGDEIGKVVALDGTEYTMKLGNHVAIGLGALYSPFSVGKFHLDFNASVSYGYWSAGVDDAIDSLELRRMPVDLSASVRYVFGRDVSLRAGPGVTSHIGTTLIGNGSLDALRAYGKVSIGAYGEVGLTFFKMLELTFRYTKMEMDFAGNTMDASSIGGGLNLIYPIGQ